MSEPAQPVILLVMQGAVLALRAHLVLLIILMLWFWPLRWVTADRTATRVTSLGWPKRLSPPRR